MHGAMIKTLFHLHMWSKQELMEQRVPKLRDVKFRRRGSPKRKTWSGPEGSRKLRFPDFMKTAQDGGKVVSLMHRPPLPPGNTPGTHFC